jgi:hypothetical protein
VRHGADRAGAASSQHVAGLEHRAQRLVERLDLLDEHRLDLAARADGAADRAAVGGRDRRLAAAYTSVTSSASPGDSTVAKSSSRSRVRV